MERGASRVAARVAARFGVLDAACGSPCRRCWRSAWQASERYFTLPKGGYGRDSLLLLLAFLARLPSLESWRHGAPGEWGQLLGRDRAPEVRTLRQQVRLLAGDEPPSAWRAELCRQWLEAAPEQAATLSSDDQVRV